MQKFFNSILFQVIQNVMDLTGGVCPIQTSNLLKRNKECLAIFIKGTYCYITLCISYGKILDRHSLYQFVKE